MATNDSEEESWPVPSEERRQCMGEFLWEGFGELFLVAQNVNVLLGSSEKVPWAGFSSNPQIR